MEENVFRSPCDGNESLEVKFACIPGKNGKSSYNNKRMCNGAFCGYSSGSDPFMGEIS